MTRQLLTILMGGLIVAFAPQCLARNWTDDTGKYSIEAELVKVKGRQVVLKRSDGLVVEVPIDRLSTADRRYVRSWQQEAADKQGDDAVEETTVDGSIASGKIQGQDFLLERTEFQPNGGIITLSQGGDFIPDRGMILFLFLKEGDSLEGKTYTVSGNERLGSTPHIHVKWKKPGDRMPKTEVVMGDYQMKLQFGKAANNILPGKIALRITEKVNCTINGTFEVDLSGERHEQGGSTDQQLASAPSRSAERSENTESNGGRQFADLEVFDVFLSEKGFLRARIRNRGTKPVEDLRVLFYVDDDHKSIVRGIALDAGEEHLAGSQRLPEGSHIVIVRADVGNDIDEPDEANNSMKTTLSWPP